MKDRQPLGIQDFPSPCIPELTLQKEITEIPRATLRIFKV